MPAGDRNPAAIDGNGQLYNLLKPLTWWLLASLICIACGVLAAVAGTGGASGALGWVALIPVIWAVRRCRFWGGFWYGWMFGIGFVFVGVFWFASYGIWLLLALSLAYSIPRALTFAFYALFRKRLDWFWAALSFPLLWMVQELALTKTHWGFPWPVLAHSQHDFAWLVHFSALTGFFGVSFILCLFQSAVAEILDSRSTIQRRFGAGLITLVLTAAALTYGAVRQNVVIRALDESGVEATPITIVQGDISSYERWDGKTTSEFRAVYHRLTKDASVGVAGGLVLWPENAVPSNINSEGARLSELSSGLNRTLVAFAQDTDFYDHEGLRISEADGPIHESRIGEARNFNSGFIFGPDGRNLGRISKTHLVIMGEAVPFRGIIPEIMDEYPWGDLDFIPGALDEDTEPIETPVGDVAILVCYESFFPGLSRRFVNHGADLICEGTNTSWFYDRQKVVAGYYEGREPSWPLGYMDASIQHANNDVFRAVECGVYFARAASTGVSSLIDPAGREWIRTGTFVEANPTANVPLMRVKTPYLVLGDWLPLLGCLFFAVLFLTYLARGYGDDPYFDQSQRSYRF